MKFNKKHILYVLFTLFTLNLANAAVLADEVDSPNHKDGKHYTCIHFINEYNNQEVRKSCTPEGTSTTKTYTHNKTQESTQGSIFTLIGWYDEAGSYVSDSTNPAKISVQLTASTEKCEDKYFYLRWQELKAPILIFNYIDKVSTGSGSWTNSDGNTSAYQHTFTKPEDQDHFNFIHWAIESDIYNPGEHFNYSFEGKEYNTTETITAYAWWQSSVTLNLFDENTLLKTTEDFEKVSIDGFTPTKKGYTFTGWADETGALVTEDTFYPEEVSIEKVTPRIINLYAIWKKNETPKNETPKKENHAKVVKVSTVSNPPATIIPPKTGIE